MATKFRDISPVAEERGLRTNEVIALSFCLEYKEHVICRDRVHCYDHAVHLLECHLFLLGQTRRRIHTDQELMDALVKADKAFVSWAARSIEERAKVIARTAAIGESQSSKLL